MLKIRSSWFPRFYAGVAKAKNPEITDTTVEIASAVPKLQEEEGNPSVLVIAKASNSKYDYRGYFSKKINDHIYEILKTAQEQQINLLMRFERSRAEGTSPDVPIAKYMSSLKEAQGSLFRVFTGIYDFNEKKWWTTSNLQSDPEKDPESFYEWMNTWIIPKQEEKVDVAHFFSDKEENEENASECSPKKGGEVSIQKEQEILDFTLFLMETSKKQDIFYEEEDLISLSVILYKLSLLLCETWKKERGDESKNSESFWYHAVKNLIKTLITLEIPLPKEKGLFKEYTVQLFQKGSKILKLTTETEKL